MRFICAMKSPFYFPFLQNTFWLSPERVIFWEEEQALILADLHFGKSGHFRKSGIAVPQNIYKEELQRLTDLVTHFKVKQLLVVGDLFHSAANKEMDLFLKWRKDFASLDIHLIKGNHDILKAAWYQEAGIACHEMQLNIRNIAFIHDYTELKERVVGQYYISGHIHPGIGVKGLGKQNLKFPCFYFGKTYGVLPAFSRFTGLHTIEPKKNEMAFAILEDSILEIQ